MNAIRKNLFTITTIIVFLFAYSQIFIPGRSSYSPIFRVLDCNNLSHMAGCRHEIGHKMDQDLGMPSQSFEFGYAVQLYLLTELKQEHPSNLATTIITYPGVFINDTSRPGADIQVELYAAIYAWSRGDISLIPDILQKFYSTDTYYLDLYSCLSRLDNFNICDGRNFSYIPKT